MKRKKERKNSSSSSSAVNNIFLCGEKKKRKSCCREIFSINSATIWDHNNNILLHTKPFLPTSFLLNINRYFRYY